MLLSHLLRSVGLGLLVLHAAAAHQTGSEDFDCVPVPLRATLCSGVLHTHTKLPNWFGDRTQSDLVATSGRWQKVQQVVRSCHPHALQFLCSLITPICFRPDQNTRPVHVPPCRHFCEDVHRSCVMPRLNFQFAWPSDFRCESFPQSGICFSPNVTLSTPYKSPPRPSCAVCNAESQNKSLQQLYCESSVAMTGYVSSERFVSVTPMNVLKGVRTAMRFASFVSGNSNGNQTRIIMSSNACRCHSDVQQKQLILAKQQNGRLQATLLLPLSKLTVQQKLDLRSIRSPSFHCSSLRHIGLAARLRDALKRANGSRQDYVAHAVTRAVLIKKRRRD